jgi:Tfp pilus assembly protein PilV
MTVRVKRENRSERGFTMIETMISLVLMMIVSLGAASLFMFSIRNNSGAADRAASLAVAQQRMERLRSAEFTDASLNSGTTDTTVTAAGRRYGVQTTICNTSACGGSATLKRITVQVTPLDAGTMWASNSVTLTSLRTSTAAGDFLQ